MAFFTRQTKPLRTGLAASALALCASLATAAEVPITIVINQSPWFPGFQAVVEKYEEDTGNTVNLDVNPFAGSLEKQRTAVRAGESPFDILIMNAGFFVEFYTGGFMQPLTGIDADFALSEDIFTFDDSVCWDATAKTITCDGDGQLVSVPVNPFLPLLHYRSDLYEEHGLEVPTTWDQLYENAKVMHNPPRMYGISQRGQRGAFDVTFDVFPYILSHGGGVIADQKGGDYTVTINSPETLAGMETYLKLANDVGHPSTAGQTQTNVIQNMATGRAGHIQGVPAPAQFDDPKQSAVVGKVDYAVVPGTEEHGPAPGLGHWLAGIPRNVSDENKQAALAFLTWFQTDEAQHAYAEAGSPPVSKAVMTSDMADEEPYRYMRALAASIPTAQLTFTIPEASQVLAVTELRLNQAIGGELELKEALNMAAEEIAKVLSDAGYDAPMLDPLQ
ncbi:carbohydrate ABC transporter substrate-binding protein (CUT1 family) [Primorskyibacter sedentarius]|uniref:Carbohydrate ABC transporter substrate-binding protein (CUT1 family) n=1 Tax=Primorskyibacter sedentarius TaxID=745311 RepID=A0A4R3J4N4_9RHOB|nr:extracellular solute-binding protein [Primorskyibacter sedentarius]TCS59736.1 carbohydrate ABC transporter substrate-binding protein (CUT1 family) [Primorskyibacter sedentarius]